ncbi:MAG: hypothetical protein Q4B65_01510 [Candidatus Saccharibacteria bacterium]|nr:hypothetical protein [Candidatus Saccharibacteria bacterium]
MRAQIVKINQKTIVLKNEKGVFATVSKNKLDFDYNLGDTITVEKNGDELYFLPNSAPKFQTTTDFWGDNATAKTILEDDDTEWYKEEAIICSIGIIGLAVAGFFFAFRICLWISIILLICAFSCLPKTNPSKKSLAITLLVIGIILWVIEYIIATELNI